MPKKVKVRIQVMVELTLSLENWNENSSIDQVHREGAEAGLARINKLCDGYVHIVGKPSVEAVITEKR